MKWPLATLEDVITFRGGGTPRKDNPSYWSDEIPWATVKDFKGLCLSETQDSISAKGLESSSANLIPAGHVIIPTRMALGKAAINSIDLAINQDLRALIPKKPVDTTYLLHSMLGLADIIERNGSGATVKGITQAKLAKLQIPLPPLAEQKRIAAILDAADGLRAKRRESLAQLDTLLQSTFLDMFGDPVTNPKGWKIISVGDEIEFLTSGSRGWAQYYADSGAIFIRIQNLKNGRLDLSDIAYVDPPESAEARRTKVVPGDVLLSITADLGRTAVVPEGIGTAHINQHLAILRFKDLNPVFVSYQLASNGGQSQFARLNREGVKAGLNFNDVKSVQLTKPPLDLQHRFATIVESIEQQKARLRSHLAELDTLFASLQQRAFNGEL